MFSREYIIKPQYTGALGQEDIYIPEVDDEDIYIEPELEQGLLENINLGDINNIRNTDATFLIEPTYFGEDEYISGIDNNDIFFNDVVLEEALGRWGIKKIFKGIRRIGKKVVKKLPTAMLWKKIRKTSFMKKMAKKRVGKWLKQPFRILRKPKRLLGVMGLTAKGRKRWMKAAGKIATSGILALKPKYRKKAAIGMAVATAVVVGTVTGTLPVMLQTAGSFLQTGVGMLGKGAMFLGKGAMGAVKMVGKGGLKTFQVTKDFFMKQGFDANTAMQMTQQIAEGRRNPPPELGMELNQRLPGTMGMMRKGYEQMTMFGGMNTSTLLIMMGIGTILVFAFGDKKSKIKK